MYQGKTLQELATAIERQAMVKVDYVLDTRQLTMLGGRELHLPEEVGEFEVMQHTHRQIGARLGIPAKFYDRLRVDHPGLLDENVNTLFRAEPERRMLRAFDWTRVGTLPDAPNAEVRAFLSDRYRRLDNEEIAESLLPILGEIPEVRFESCELTDTRMYIKAVAPRVQGTVKVGDDVQAGVMISNSEVGNGALSVQPFVFRLICLNGMMTMTGKRQYHVGRAVETDETFEVFSDETRQLDDAALMAKLRDVVRAAVDETRFAAIVQELKDATESVPMVKPLDSLERLANKFTLDDGEQQSILSHLIEGGDVSAYGMIQAITRASQDAANYERATEMEMIGGQILAMAGTREWAQIAS